MNMTRKIVIALDGAERSALAILAQRERRDMRDQAALIVREKLIERGLLPADPSMPMTAQPTESQAVAHVA